MWKRDGWRILGDKGEVLAKYFPWDVSGCRQEDHDIINKMVAAPELLEALEELSGFVERVLGKAIAGRPIRKQARAAIAKARGEA